MTRLVRPTKRTSIALSKSSTESMAQPTISTVSAEHRLDEDLGNESFTARMNDLTPLKDSGATLAKQLDRVRDPSRKELALKQREINEEKTTEKSTTLLEIANLAKACEEKWSELASPASQWQSRSRNTLNYDKGYAQALTDVQCRLNGIVERAKRSAIADDFGSEAVQ